MSHKWTFWMTWVWQKSKLNFTVGTLHKWVKHGVDGSCLRTWKACRNFTHKRVREYLVISLCCKRDDPKHKSKSIWINGNKRVLERYFPNPDFNLLEIEVEVLQWRLSWAQVFYNSVWLLLIQPFKFKWAVTFSHGWYGCWITLVLNKIVGELKCMKILLQKSPSFQRAGSEVEVSNLYICM